MMLLPKDFFLRYRWILLALIILALINVLYVNQLFAFQFVDEEDNLILGHFLLHGQKLYLDLFSHHQPLAYIISAFIQLGFNPDNAYQLIYTHRIFMIFWSSVWFLGLVGRFGWKPIVPLIIFELAKYFVWGNLFLSESLSVYPVLYLVFYSLEKKFSHRQELIWIGFLIAFSALLLAPLWPMLFFYLCYLYWLIKPTMKQLLFFGFGLIIPILIVLPFIDIHYYFRNVFYINFKYYIPQSGEEQIPLALLKAIVSPIIALLGENAVTTLSFILRALFIFFVFSLFTLFKKQKYSVLIFVMIFLTMANLRYYDPYLEYRDGFHLIVWLAVFIVFATYFYQEIIVSTKSLFKKNVLGISLTVLIFLTMLSVNHLFKIRNLNQDFEKNYGQKMIYGDAIKAMRLPGDTLFVIPDEWLLYFQGDVKNHNKMVNYYGWMSLVWELNDPVIAKFKSEPATFFYCDCSEETVFLYSNQYQQLMRNGAKTPIWVLKNKFVSLNDIQRQELRALNFQLE